MFSSDLENAYAHEVERHKDEIRAAVIHNFESQSLKRRRLTPFPLALLAILSLILASLTGQ